MQLPVTHARPMTLRELIATVAPSGEFLTTSTKLVIY